MLKALLPLIKGALALELDGVVNRSTKIPDEVKALVIKEIHAWLRVPV